MAGGVANMLADATMEGGRATLGRVKRIRVMGEQIGLGKQFWWSRMPERIYTAGLGEWSLAARWNVDVDPEATTVEPYYMMRHRHLHRNGRFDVTGFSPLDGERQNAQVQQFSPYGLLVAEGEVEPDGDSTMEAVATSTMNETHRTRVLALGLTGKQYDPETQLYYFGYRWYSPELRRWTQKEPLGLDGPNLYHFNFSRPTSGYDIDGLRYRPVDDSPGNRLDEAYTGIKTSAPQAAYGSVQLGGAFRNPRVIAAIGARYPTWDPLSATNAIRHCVWQCWLTHLWGEKLAKAYGDAHEPFKSVTEYDIGNSAYDWDAEEEGDPNDGNYEAYRDTIADYANNEVGRDVGHNLPGGMSVIDACMQACDNAMLCGRLVDRNKVKNPGIGLVSPQFRAAMYNVERGIQNSHPMGRPKSPDAHLGVPVPRWD